MLATTLSAVACADYTPDSDVQISCRGEHAVELCTHAANAAAELNPHLAYEVVVRDPEVTGVTWRDAEQWRIETAPAGAVVCGTNGTCARPLGCGSSRYALGVTSYQYQTVYVVECAIGRHDLGEIVRHEIGHALGAIDHVADHEAIMRPTAEKRRTTGDSYTRADLDFIANVRRGESNTLLEALVID